MPEEPPPLRHAVSRWFLGDTDTKGNPSAESWKTYGFDLDGLSSTPEQTNHCKPASGGKVNDIQVDGNKGIDNSFGRHFVNGLMATLLADPSDRIEEQIAKGNETLLLDLGKIGNASSYENAPAQWIRVIGQDVPPPQGDWSTYSWRPLQGKEVPLPEAYLDQNVWFSGEVTEVTFAWVDDGFTLKFPIKRARASVDISDRKKGIGGQLGGIIPTEALVSEMEKLLGNFGSIFCGNSSAKEAIAESIRQSSDILLDGTQDPTKECNAISIGLGFETRATQLGSAVPEEISPDPCEPP
jgi:hypothetical protein